MGTILMLYILMCTSDNDQQSYKQALWCETDAVIIGLFLNK